MIRPVPRGALVVAGMGAGFAVGLVDGGWAAIATRTDLGGGLLAALLAGAVDGVLGAVGGMVMELVVRWTAWGRQMRAPRWARIVVVVLLGVAAGAATVAVVVGSLERRNRFLAGGIACLIALVAGLVGAALSPAAARVLGWGRGIPFRQSRTGRVGLVLLGPLAVAAIDFVVMSAVMNVHGPVTSRATQRQLALVGLEAALLPALLLWAEGLPVRLRWRWAVPLTVLVFGAPLAYFVAANWSDHLRFVPWRHVTPGIAIAALALGSATLLGRWMANVRARPRWGWFRLGLPALAFMALVALLTAESETARKVTSARVGLVGPTLAAARRALDSDGDGYPRLLGGGDCDDDDPAVYPGVLDVPDDGIDQDCNGRDASVAVLTPPRFGGVPDAVPRELNLLLVTIDTVRADHLGCYGYSRPTSPAIDALAAQGTLFLNGWAHAPSTRYSMPAIATGRWPSAITWDESIWWPRIAAGVPTLPEALKALGYFTAAFYSYDYFSPADRRGFERGVDLYRADRAVLHQAVNGPMESRGSSSREMADDAITFFETHREGKFFLWLHFYDPHLSYEPHAEVPSFGKGRVDLYDGEIRFTDLHLGRVLDRLRALGLWDRTAIVVTGDHGEGFGEHGVTEHGFDLYTAQTKVPFIVRVPGLAPRRTDTPASHVDLAPTLVNLARGPQAPTFLGRSLVSDIAGTAALPGTAKPPVVFQEVTSERGKKRALVSADLHLIWNWTPDNTTECYDRHADPDERRDLWGRSGDGPCRAMKSDLQEMVSALALPNDAARKLKSHVFAPGATAPPPAKLLDATLGDLVKVEGYTLSPPAETVRAGGETELAVLFECQRALTNGWRFFFHMTGPGGSFRNLDHVPVEGAMPPAHWRPGQRILDRVHISFPPGSTPGTYQVITGLFRGSERLPVAPSALSDGNKALRLVTIEVR